MYKEHDITITYYRQKSLNVINLINYLIILREDYSKKDLKYGEKWWYVCKMQGRKSVIENCNIAL